MIEQSPDNDGNEAAVNESNLPGMLMDEAGFTIDAVRYGLTSKDALVDARKNLDMAAEAMGLPKNWREDKKKISRMGGVASKAVTESSEDNSQSDRNSD